MNFLILANGQAPSRALLDELIAACDCFIATDGAAHAASTLQVEPDIICGDFDSIDLARAKREFPGTEFVETSDQYLGDLEKALRLALERGATRVVVAGASGGRLDHLLGNMTLLFRYHADVDLRIVDEISEVRCVSEAAGGCAIRTVEHDLISVFSFDGLARVTLSGVRWPLVDAELPIGTLGLSNVATSEEVVVTVQGGAAVVVHTSLCPQSSGHVEDDPGL